MTHPNEVLKLLLDGFIKIDLLCRLLCHTNNAYIFDRFLKTILPLYLDIDIKKKEILFKISSKHWLTRMEVKNRIFLLKCFNF